MKLGPVFALLICTPMFAGTKVNPADYTLTAHVTCSFERGNSERIVVDLDGKQMELVSNNDAFLPLALGDYKARLLKDESPDAYEVKRQYEVLLPDGKVRAFLVSGLGTSLCGAAGS